jgi:hypothetical protein
VTNDNGSLEDLDTNVIPDMRETRSIPRVKDEAKTYPRKSVWVIGTLAVLLAIGTTVFVTIAAQSLHDRPATTQPDQQQSESWRNETGRLAPSQPPASLTTKVRTEATVFICGTAQKDPDGTANIRTSIGIVKATPAQVEALRGGLYYTMVLLDVALPTDSPPITINGISVGPGTTTLMLSERHMPAPKSSGKPTYSNCGG